MLNERVGLRQLVLGDGPPGRILVKALNTLGEYSSTR